eukprot:180417-Karenia_brevis.AAC.1
MGLTLAKEKGLDARRADIKQESRKNVALWEAEVIKDLCLPEDTSGGVVSETYHDDCGAGEGDDDDDDDDDGDDDDDDYDDDDDDDYDDD